MIDWNRSIVTAQEVLQHKTKDILESVGSIKHKIIFNIHCSIELTYIWT